MFCLEFVRPSPRHVRTLRIATAIYMGSPSLKHMGLMRILFCSRWQGSTWIDGLPFCRAEITDVASFLDLSNDRTTSGTPSLFSASCIWTSIPTIPKHPLATSSADFSQRACRMASPSLTKIRRAARSPKYPAGRQGLHDQPGITAECARPMLLLAQRRHGIGCRLWPLSPRKQTKVHDLTLPVYEFTS